MEPCMHGPPFYDCRAKHGADTGKLVPHVRHCEDMSWGLKLVHPEWKERCIIKLGVCRTQVVFPYLEYFIITVQMSTVLTLSIGTLFSSSGLYPWSKAKFRRSLNRKLEAFVQIFAAAQEGQMRHWIKILPRPAD
jgi:hypothetical protein